MSKQTVPGRDSASSPSPSSETPDASGPARKDPREASSPSKEATNETISLDEIIERARKGDKQALSRLHQQLKHDPELANRLSGDYRLRVEQMLLPIYSGNDPAVRTVMEFQLQSFRAELLAEGDGSFVDRLLVESVTSSWLALKVAECQLAAILGTDFEAQASGKAIRERVSKEQARYLKMMNALVTTRKLLQPRVSALDLAAGPKTERASKKTFERKPAEEFSMAN